MAAAVAALAVAFAAALAGTPAAVAADGAGVGAADGPATLPAPDAQRGRRLLSQYQCGACHTIPGVAAARGTLAASLDAYGRRSYIAGRVPNRAALLAQWIVAPASLVPGTAMPAMGVGAAEARDIAAYLHQLR